MPHRHVPYGHVPHRHVPPAPRAGKGAVVLSACSHAGIVNVVRHVKEVAQGPVFGVLGGETGSQAGKRAGGRAGGQAGRVCRRTRQL